MDIDRLYKIFKASPTPTSILKADTSRFIYVMVNDAFLEMTQKTEEELVGNSLFEKFPANPEEGKPTGVEKLKKSFEKVIEKKSTDELSKVRYDIRKADGTYEKEYWKIINSPILDENGEVELIVNTANNVTDQVHKEVRFQSLVEQGNDVLIILNSDGSPKYVSPSIKKVLGYSVSEALKFDISKIVHPIDQQLVASEIQESLQKPGETIEVSPARMRHKNGDWLWFAGSIKNMLHDPDIAGIIDNFRDVTKSKKAQEALKETKELYQSLVQTINGVVWEAKADTFEFTYVSPQSKNIFGYTSKEWINNTGLWENSIHPDDRDDAVNFCKIETSKGLNHDFEYRFKKASGDYIWVHDIVTVIKRKSQPNLLRGLMIDITEQKNIREELKLTEEKYRNVVENSTNMFYSHDADGILNYVSPQSMHFLGLEPEEAKKRWVEFITDHPVNEIGIAITEKAIETGERQDPYELQLKTVDDEIIWVEVNEAPIVVDGNTEAIVGSLTDVTRRKKYEEDLQESLERYNYVAKATRDAIYDRDLINDKVHWGDGFYTIFGYSKDKIDDDPRSWNQLVHPDDLKELELELTPTYENPDVNHWSKEYRFLKADGNYAYVNENGYIIRDDNGKAVRMIGSIQDISNEVQNKKALEASLTEKETLLSEIHHRVKNNLAVVSGMMQLQAFESDDESLQAKLYDSVVRIKTMATVHELLYQSQSFSQLEFSETLQKLVENISNTLQTSESIKTEITCDQIKLNINQAIPASLIVNEVVTNIYKHGFKGKESGKIDFELVEVNDHIIIKIEDNGVGFDPNFDLEKSSSLGIHLIKLLSEQIKSTYSYKNKEDNSGTIFKLEFQRSIIQSGIGSAVVQ